MSVETSHASGRRTGVSLLEVLISIGVLAIGMLGAATMLPLAKFYATEASKFDRASALGQQAYHDMQIRGYLSIKKWLKPQVGGFNYTNASVVLLDPLARSYADATGAPAPQFFPAFPNNGSSPPVPSAPQVFRSNLDINGAWNDAVPAEPPNPQYVAMPYPMADRIFRAADDLVFDIPTRSGQRPSAQSGSLSPDYAGDFSWFVTISHPPVDVNNTLNMQRYVASVVIFHKREINFNPADWPGPPAQDEPPPERMVLADFLQTPVYGNQVYPLPASAVGAYAGGGAVMLRTIQGIGGTNWLDDLKPNQYVMLSANFGVIDFANGNLKSTFPKASWYRIVSVDAGAKISGGVATRIINVDGADWPAANANGGFGIWTDADGSFGSPSGQDTVYCTIANGAIAVYEDTIVVNNSLLKD